MIGMRQRAWIALLGATLQSVVLSHSVHGQVRQDASPQVAAVLILSFSWDTTELTPAVRGQLDDAIAAYRRGEPVSLVISGQVDRGPSSCCVSLSQRRAHLVRTYLVAADVTEADIVTEAFGVDRPRPDHAQILITFGPGAGW